MFSAFMKFSDTLCFRIAVWKTLQQKGETNLFAIFNLLLSELLLTYFMTIDWNNKDSKTCENLLVLMCFCDNTK